MDEPLRAFPSWFLRIVCERCGKERMISEKHMPQGDIPIRDIRIPVSGPFPTVRPGGQLPGLLYSPRLPASKLPEHSENRAGHSPTCTR
jgi:hypothetical protein